MAEETFNDFTKQARIEFVNYIDSLKWDNELRTNCENLLIAYDQMKAKCDGMNEPSEKEVLPLCGVVKVEQSVTTVKCVNCGAKLHEHELNGGGNCCDICWLST